MQINMNQIMTVCCNLELKVIMLSEINQREKNNSNDLTHLR